MEGQGDGQVGMSTIKNMDRKVLKAFARAMILAMKKHGITMYQDIIDGTYGSTLKGYGDDDDVDICPVAGKDSLDLTFDLCSLRVSGDLGDQASQVTLPASGGTGATDATMLFTIGLEERRPVSADDLALVDDGDDIFTVAKLQGGYTRYFSPRGGFTPGVGGAQSFGIVPEPLAAAYGRRVNTGLALFVTVRPAGGT